MKLSAAYFTVAVKLQEAAELSANDVSKRLADAIQDQYRGTDKWGYYVDHFGDDTSGDVIYSCSGDTCRAPYELSDAGGAAKCIIDFDKAEDVVPRTIYEPEMDEAAHYAAMEESLKAEGLYDHLPLYERFISKAERKSAAADDFAGKGKSFPILKPGDIMAAVHSMGRAGKANLGPSGIKGRIIAIAKRKGWEKYLPKAWQTTDATESASSASTAAAGSLALQESAATLERIVLREARADYEIKLIAPGKGSSAFYPAEVLKRDGPQVFGAGTHVYLNHPTAAEEAQRPEGDVANLAGVLTTQAQYHESHSKGPGLYARMKVFADHAQMVEDKAPHVGMSIRAAGDAVMESGRMKMQDGVPILGKLVAAQSVDVVTRAGAGGMILTEAARAAGEVQMTEAEIKKLVADAVTATLTEALKPQTGTLTMLERRALRGDAQVEATRLLESVSLPEASKARIVRDVVGDGSMLPIKDGALESDKLKTLVEAAAKAEGAYVAQLTGGGRVFGMGAAAVIPIDPQESTRRKEAAKEEMESAVSIFESLGLPPDAAKFAATGRAS